MYLVLDVQDNEEQNLIRLFPRCAPSIIPLPSQLTRAYTYILNLTERKCSSTRLYAPADVFSSIATVSKRFPPPGCHRVAGEKLTTRRWHLPLPRLRRHVRDAILPNVLGGRPPHRAKSALLHLSERRLLNPNQGARFALWHCALCIVVHFI